MKHDELLEALPLEVMRNLEPKKRMEIIRSIDTVKLYQAADSYERCKEAMEEAKNAFDVAMTELEEATKKMQEAKERLEQKKMELEPIKMAYEEKKEALKKEQKRIALIHSTASLKQLEENLYSTIFVTESDQDMLEVLTPSKIFKRPENLKWVKIIPESLKNLEEGSRKDGIFAFCELAMDLTDLQKEKTELEVVLLYKDEIIREVLEKNGLLQ